MKDRSQNNVVDRAWLWHRKGGPMLRDQEIAAQITLAPGALTDGPSDAIKAKALHIRREALQRKLARVNEQLEAMEAQQ